MDRFWGVEINAPLRRCSASNTADQNIWVDLATASACDQSGRLTIRIGNWSMISWLFKCLAVPKTRFLAVSVAPIVLALVLGGSAEASCAATTPEQQAADARVIATGTVVSLEDLAEQGTMVSVEIDWIYKGRSQRDIRFRIASGVDQKTSIDIPFEVGSRYLFYLVAEGGPLTTHICAGTREIGPEDKPEVVGARPGYGPGASPGREIEVPPYIPAAGVAVSVALLLGAFVLARKVGRRPKITDG